MGDELCFVQFPHPGGERGPDEPGGTLSRWARGDQPHMRKFLQSSGAWLEKIDGELREGEIAYWGEWEADSAVEAMAPASCGSPRWKHRPFFSGAEGAPPDSVPQNTDPFV